MSTDVKPLSKDELWEVFVKYGGHPSVMRVFATLNETRITRDNRIFELTLALQLALVELDNIASYSGAAGNWPLQDAVTECRRVLGLTPGEHLKDPRLDERARIVAWLRTAPLNGPAETVYADAIECGAYKDPES